MKIAFIHSECDAGMTVKTGGKVVYTKDPKTVEGEGKNGPYSFTEQFIIVSDGPSKETDGIPVLVRDDDIPKGAQVKVEGTLSEWQGNRRIEKARVHVIGGNTSKPAGGSSGTSRDDGGITMREKFILVENINTATGRIVAAGIEKGEVPLAGAEAAIMSVALGFIEADRALLRELARKEKPAVDPVPEEEEGFQIPPPGDEDEPPPEDMGVSPEEVPW